MEPPRREPGRITIGTDPSGMTRRPPQGSRRRGGRPHTCTGVRPARPHHGRPGAAAAQHPGRHRAGIVIAGVFVAAPCGVPSAGALITVLLAIAGWEFFGKITEKGTDRRSPPGSPRASPAACRLLDRRRGLPLVMAFAFIAGSSASSAPRASSPARCRTWPSPRWASCGSACSVRTARSSCTCRTAPFGGQQHRHRHPVHGRPRRRGQRHRRPARRVVDRQVTVAAGISPAKTIEGLIGGALSPSSPCSSSACSSTAHVVAGRSAAPRL